MASAAPSQAELETMLQEAARIFQEILNFADVNSANYTSMDDVITQALEGDFAKQASAGVDQLRSLLNSMLSPSAVRSMTDPIMREWGNHIDAPESDILTIFSRFYTWMIDNSETVVTRSFVFGTPSAGGGNTGDGTLQRLNVDDTNNNIENQTPDDFTAEVITDASTGATRNQESFQFRGGNAGKDLLDVQGTGDTQSQTAQDTTASELLNSGFDVLEGTIAEPTAIPNWTVTDTSDVTKTVSSTNFTLDETNIYLPAPDGNTTVRALNMKTADTRLTQRFDEIGISVNRRLPYSCRIFFNAQVGTATGTLVLKMGNQSTSVVVDGLTGWQELVLDLDTNSWPDNFTQDDLYVRVDWNSGGTGELLIDDIIFVPLFSVDGGWLVLTPGQTPFVVDDVYTWADTAGGGIIQQMFWRIYGVYVPSDTTGAATIPDPS